MHKIVIIGGGAAGFAAAQKARKTDSTAKISLLCGEKRIPYFRPRLCELLSGLDEEKMNVKPLSWFNENNIELIFDKATKINTETKTVSLAEGKEIEYDALIIATGANGNLPAIDGNNKNGVTVFRNIAQLRDAEKIEGAALIIGGGLLGLEAAGALAAAGRKVMIADHNPQLLNRQLDSEAGEFFAEFVKKAGVEPLYNASLAEIRGESPALKAVFKDGREIDCALIIFAAGIRSEFTLAKEAGLACDKAIIIDEKCHTSIPDIFACGDCAEFNGKVSGLWGASQTQGDVAGANAAGADLSYTPVAPSYIMNALGTKIISLGNIRTEQSASSAEGDNFIKLFFNEGKICGAIIIGDISLQGKIAAAIKNGASKEEAMQIAGLTENPEAAPAEIYVCAICGYSIDLSVGDDPIAAGTAWEDIPESWTCPRCGVPKAMFEKQE